MHSIISILMMFSVLTPMRGWYAPDQPLEVSVKLPDGAAPAVLYLSDFTGRTIEPDANVPLDITGEGVVDVKKCFPSITTPGCYLLYAVPKTRANREFLGTPLVITVRADNRQGAPPGAMAIHVEPMCFGVITTDKGPMTVAFYYDAAPNTVENFVSLATQKFYDGLTFHRIIKDFIVQGGDPRGDGTGGPGYCINAEFNDRPHAEGVLSMARGTDPNEVGGAMPRSEFANSAGSQFFICLNYEKTRQLDRRYTAFGRIMGGIDTVKSIASVDLADGQTGKPRQPPRIEKIEIHPVTSTENPYPKLLEQMQPSTIGR